jgi:hypothetical protein
MMLTSTMRKMRLWFLVMLGLGLGRDLDAQIQGKSIDFQDYQGLRCAGELPVDFRQTSVAKARKAESTIADKDLSRTERLEESEHAVRTVFEVDEILMSGRVLFGDPLTQFVESVAEKLLKANDREDLLDELRFYVLKSQEVNAYATSNGVVMVTVGLLSRIENESQLAFILAHEIQHYVLKHSLQQFKYRKVQRKKSNKSEEDQTLKELYQFSKDHEMEADEKGFQMMLRSGYDLVEGVFVFDMLKYGDFPFLEMKLALDSFEHDAYQFPKSLKDAVALQVQAAEIEDAKYLEQEGDDDNKTHPSLDRRVVRLRDMIDGEPKGSRAFFLVGEQRFKEMQKAARHELLLIYARRADYGELFYLTQVMRKLYGQSLFFDKMEGMSLYGLLLHDSKEHDLDRYGCRVSESRGDWRSVIVGLRELDLKGLGAFSAMRIWMMVSRDSGLMKDALFGKIAKGVYGLVQDACNFRLQDFLDYLPAEEAAKLDSTLVKPDVGEGGLRNPRSRVARSRAANVVSGDYHMAIFYGLSHRESLQAFLSAMKVYPSSTATTSEKSYKKKRSFRGLDDFHHLVLLEPNVQRTVGNDVNSHRDPFDEAIKREQLANYWERYGKALDIQVDVIPASTGVEGLTTDLLNRQMLINDWMMERINNDTQSMVLYGSRQIEEAMGGDKNRYLAWTAVESTLIRRQFKVTNLLLCMVLYPILPYYLYYQLGSEREYNEFLLVYDVVSGKLIQVKEDQFAHRWRGDFVKSRVYNNLYYLIHGGK